MIVIINTGIGNFKSIKNMLSRIGEKSIISNNVKEIEHADRLILPGVGSFDKGMQALKDNGLIDVLKYKALSENVNLLGICLGMQMLAECSEEGILPGLGIIKGDVKKFDFTKSCEKRKIPHMGWNYVIPKRDSILFNNYDIIPRFYFTHSYWFDCEDEANILAKTPYGNEFTTAVRANNIYGVQFHPEKSHRFGFQLLRNFISC